MYIIYNKMYGGTQEFQECTILNCVWQLSDFTLITQENNP